MPGNHSLVSKCKTQRSYPAVGSTVSFLQDYSLRKTVKKQNKYF
uniref:Uncharacterized protein n=1 Tax=Anguilla anguilla TaxID=7936 RepID=A0A0E9TPA4_ANGAN